MNESVRIEYRKGDLFSAAEPGAIIMHGCNAQGVMGSGVAKIVKERYPEAYEAYKHFTDKYLPSYLLGKALGIDIRNGPTILNAITQEHYGRENTRYVSYDAVAKVFDALAKIYGVNAVINMPKIGAGLGNGDWNVIESIIKASGIKAKIVVWEL